jgi:hypothetical protein
MSAVDVATLSSLKRRWGFAARMVTARVAHDEVSESFEVAALELPCAIVRSEADQRPDLAALVCRCVCTEHPRSAARGDV